MNLVDKIKKALTNKGMVFTIALVLVGILLISLPQDNTAIKNDDEITLDEYKARLEEELSDMCRSVKGVGKCYVMITFLRGEENTYKGSLLIESKPPRVLGVSIVCQGADSNNVRASLTEMICALFDIGANRVAVLKMEN